MISSLSLRIAAACLVSTAMLPADEPHPASVTEVEHSDLGYKLPLPILNRKHVSDLSAPEFRKWSEQTGMHKLPDIVDGTGSLDNASVYRAEDGTVFCADRRNMALWLHRQDHWECLIYGIRVDKTFGGAAPILPVRYMGNGWFAFSQTAPADSDQKSERGLPTAYAITYLLNSKTGEIEARSEAFLYDHNPPVKIPEEWYARTQTTPLPPITDHNRTQ